MAKDRGLFDNADELATQPVNPLIAAAGESLRKKEQEARERATRVITSAGVEMDQTRALRLINASRHTGYPTHFLAEGDTLDLAEKKIREGTYNREEFSKEAPAFAGWMAKQPANTSIGLDDLHELQKLEELTRLTPHLRQRTDGAFETLDEGGAITGYYNDPYKLKSKMSQDRYAFEQQEQLGEQMRDIYGNGLFYRFATNTLSNSTSTLGLLGAVDRQTAGVVSGIQAAANEWDSTLLAEIVGGAGGIAADTPLILLGGPLARAAKGLSTIAAAGALRAAGAVSTRAWAGLARTGLAVSESKAGQYLGRAALTGVAVQPLALREGADVYAQGGSLGDAATAWAIETVIPASFADTGIQKFVLRGLTERAGKALYMSASHLLKHAGLEATEEVTTELAHAIHESMSGLNPDALEGHALTRRLLTAGILGAGAGGAFNLPSFLAGNMRKNKPERALAAMQLGNHLETLGLAAGESKTAGRVPHDVEQVLNQVAQGAEGYLEPEAWTSFWQSKQRDPRVMAHEILGDAKVYDESLRTGAPMSMKLGTFAARLPEDARAHFAGEIRAEPDAMNRREAQAEFDKLASTDAVDDPDEQVRKSNTEKRDGIQSGIEQQLIGAGMDPNAAATEAKQTANFFMATAKAAGLDAVELASRYPITIRLDVPNILASPTGLSDAAIAALKKAEPVPGMAEESNAELLAFATRHNVDLTKPNEEIRNALKVAAQSDQRNAVGKGAGDGTVPNDAAVIAEQSGAGNLGERTGDGSGRDQGGSTAPLEGAPTVEGATGPDAAVVAVAGQYAADHGLEHGRQAEYAKIDVDRAKRIADAYAAMVHDPQDPTVAEAYQNMIAQTMEQYRALEAAGYTFYLYDESNDPYDGNPYAAMRDLRENKRMGVFATDSGFGSGATALDVSANPLLAETGVEWGFGSVDGPKRPALANDIFRAVHDVFGHSIEGAGFRARGEENAWQAHARLYTGSAVGAMTSETRGQNSWLNFGPFGEKNRNAKVKDTVFADQKTGLMPEWTWTEGIVPDQQVLDQAAFHGTGNPQPYQRFDVGKVGGPGGEGSQSFGHGLYFASRKEVAAHYRDVLSQPTEIDNWSIGDLKIMRDGAYLDYSPKSSGDVESAKAILVEDLLINEVNIQKAFDAGGVEAARTEMARVIDENIAQYAEDHPPYVPTMEGVKAKLVSGLTFDTTQTKGKVYQVDIPEDNELLDWDKKLSEQPAGVREKLRQALINEAMKEIPQDAPTAMREANQAIAEKQADKAMSQKISGEDFYRSMQYKLAPTGVAANGKATFDASAAMDAPANAAQRISEALRAAGIPGIRYLDGGSRTAGDGTHNYVIFDDSRIKIQSFEQRKGTKRGQIALGKKNAEGIRQMSITLFQAADLSTFLHESGHLYLEVLGDLSEDAKATDAIKNDYAKILKWLGVANRAEIKTVHHEQFARGYEAYLLEGKAPSSDLRAAFTRFRLWLLDLYKDVRNLNVPINDEIRGVFDRMLATEEEITDAAELLGARPLFTDAKSAGMTDAEFLKYRELADAAIADAKSELEQKAMAEVTREKKEWWKSKRDAMRLEVELEVNRQPDQIAASVLKSGTYPGGVPLPPGTTATKLSSAKVTAWIKSKSFGPEEARTVKGKLIGMSSNAGIDLDPSAQLFGFPSGDAMMQALVNRRNRNQLIDAMTDARMQAEHGNMMLDGSMAEEAKKIVNNDKRGNVLVAEVKALGKKANKRATPSEILREQANARIGRMKVMDLRPDVWRRAQAKAARMAFDLAAEGKFAGALIEKQRELLNYHLARAAQEAVDQVKSDRRYLQQFLDKGKRSQIGKAGGWTWTVYDISGQPVGEFGSEDEARQASANTPNSTWEQTSGYLQRIDDILGSYELRSATNKAAFSLISLRAWVDQQRALGVPVNIPDSVLDRTQKTHWRELSVDELGAVRDAVSNIAHLALKKNELAKIQEKREFNEVRDQAIAGMAENMKKGDPVARSHENRNGAGDWLDNFTAAHRKMSSIMRQADGGKSGGIMWSLFVRPLNEAADAEVEMRRIAAEKQKALWDAWRDKGKDITEKRTIGLDVGTMSVNEILSVALNWGNQGNRDRLMRGENWSVQQVETIIAQLDNDDMILVQGILDHIDSYWSEIKAKQQRVEGIAPDKVEAIPIVTKHGVFRGGYYPVQYDSRRSARSGNEALAEAANLYALGTATKATTKRGHVEARAMQGTGKPLSLDIDVISRHLSQVIHDLTHHETLIDLNKLLADDKMAQAIQDYMGQPTLRQINDLVRSVGVSDLTENGVDKALRHVRGGVSIAAMGFNAGTMLMQITGVGQSINRVGARSFARGVSRIFGDPRRQASAWEFIKTKSTFMANRANTQHREASEVLNQVKGKNFKHNMTQMAYWGMQRAQLMVDMPTWYAEYDNALEAGHSDADAVAQADQAVIDAQGSGLIKDLSGVQRSQWAQMFTVFYSYFNVTYNRTMESVAEFKQNKNNGAATLNLMMDFLQLYTIPAMMAMGVRALMGKGDDKDGWLTKLGKEHLSMASGTMVGVRELSAALVGGYDYRGPAGAMGFSALSNVIKQAEQGEIDAALLKSSAQAVGIWFHLPTLQAQRFVEGLLYYMGSRDANPTAILFGPPAKPQR